MKPIHNGMQAVERLLNTFTNPITLMVIVIIAVAAAIVPDPTNKAVIIATAGLVYVAAWTAIEIAQALNPAQTNHIHLGADVPLYDETFFDDDGEVMYEDLDDLEGDYYGD